MRTMIVPLGPREFIPCGQQAYSKHPGFLCLYIRDSQKIESSQSSLLGTFSQVTLEDKPKVGESWIMRMKNGVEEELYVADHTVIWSRGHTVFKTFTVDTLVKQAIWCNFSVDGEDPHQFDLPPISKHSSIEGVAVVADGTVHVFTEDGDSHDTALPFQVKNTWDFKYGLLFERNRASMKKYNSNNQGGIPENDLTTIFCLQHPLREFSPIIIKMQGYVRYMNKAHESIVFCEDDFVMTCDEHQGLHSVWRARKVSSDDIHVLESSRVIPPLHNQMNSSLCQISMSSSGISPYRGSYRGSPGYPSNSNVMPPGLTKTPRNPSLQPYSFTPHSSKAFSPSTGSMLFQSHTFSPLKHSPHVTRSPCTPVSHESLCLNYSVHETAEPLKPELCFDHMWTEPLNSTREGLSVGKAGKVFRTKDLCGQTYLVYHLDNLSQLRLVRYTQSNDKSHLIFGAVTCLQAKDAVPLIDQNMLAVLDLSGSVALYSGFTKVVKMHLSGLPMNSLSLSHGLRNTNSVPNTPQPISTPAHPSRPTSVMGNLEEVGLLSPVQELNYSGDDIGILTGDEFAFSTAGTTSKLNRLPHVIGSTIIMELTSGGHYKVDIPLLCSSKLVKSCLRALQYMLPTDTYLSYAIKWYSTRHAPGSLNGCRSEWNLFVDCLLDYLGYSPSQRMLDVLHTGGDGDSLMDFDISASPVIAAKKPKPMPDTTISQDWDYLLSKKSSVDNHVDANDDVKMGDFDASDFMLPQIQLFSTSYRRKSVDSSLAGDTSHAANQMLICVFSALHLVYEDQKLSTLTWSNIDLMSPLLFRIATKLNLSKFLYSYTLDNPVLLKKYVSQKFQDQLSAIDEDSGSKTMGCFSESFSPSIFTNLNELIKHGKCETPFPYIPAVTTNTERIFKIYDFLFNDSSNPSTIKLPPLIKTAFNVSLSSDDNLQTARDVNITGNTAEEKMLEYMVSAEIDLDDLMTWPQGVSLPIQHALEKCSENPDLNLPVDALKLLGRSDLVSQMSEDVGDWKEASLCPSTDPMRYVWSGMDSGEKETDNEFLSALEDDEDKPGSEDKKKKDLLDDNVTRLMFPNDHRIADAHNLLKSNQPCQVHLTQLAGVDDKEFLEQKQGRLLQLLNRTMALSVGRGMLLYRTQSTSSVEALKVEELNLTGKDSSNSTITLVNSSVELPIELADWAYFHNGVAAGLSIQPEHDNPSWIYLYQSEMSYQEEYVEPSFEHAGTLLGLGLNHHLKELQTLNVHNYLQKSHEMTTIGLLLGLACDKCGSCDLSTMRVLSVHISALLPSSCTQLDIPYPIQTAAVMAVGFLYLGSSQRLVAEVMLKEIDRSPTSETEGMTDRESYSLCAGFSLGMVTLGQGDQLLELQDLNMADQLYHYMTGMRKKTTVGMSEPYNQGSYSSQILEGDRANTEVTAPGSTMALALMFLKTNNNAVADWFISPNTLSLLESIRPQHLLLRTMTRALILWDKMIPSVEWVESHIPHVIQSHLKNTEGQRPEVIGDEEVDDHTVLQCHASIITGACLALGLKFAGSQEKTAFDTILHFFNFFLSLWKQPGVTLPTHPLEVIGHRLFETCLCSCLTSLCMVVAGSGNLKALQLCRYLHCATETDVNYGMQMATHMALGFLFLGRCRYTLSTSNKAVAALLVAIYPRFPVKSTDNRYHLQALRHMYVMATEKRLMVPIDVTTHRPCYARVTLEYLPTVSCSAAKVSMIAPCVLPELCFLSSISVDDKRHLPMLIDVTKQHKKLHNIIDNGLYVQLKPGCLPYIQDPKGHCSIFKQRRSIRNGIHNGIYTEENLANLLQEICHVSEDSVEQKNSLPRLIALLNDKENFGKTFFLYLSLLQISSQLDESCYFPEPLAIWQIKLAKSFQSRKPQNDAANKLLQTISSKIDYCFKKFSNENATLLQSVVIPNNLGSIMSTRLRSSQHFNSVADGTNMWTIRCLACYLVYNSVPSLIADVGNVMSPVKRKPAQDNKLIADLLNLKKLKDLGFSDNSNLLNMWYSSVNM